MKIHVLSDLHLEWSGYEPAQVEADVVVLAGDIDLGIKGIRWAREHFFCPVIYVPGNHEFWNGHLVNTLKSLREEAGDSKNFHLLHEGSVVIDGVRFLGVTGWANYTSTGNLPIAQAEALEGMRDFRKIRTGNYRRVRPQDFMLLNGSAKTWLLSELSKPHPGNTVVVTHHAPSLRSLKSSEGTGHLASAYTNAWDDLIQHIPSTWIHGDTHHCVDYRMGESRVVSNARGYPGEKTGFRPDFVIDLAPSVGC